MDLSLERPGDHHYIRSVSSAGIRILEETHTGPLIVSADTLITDWAVKSTNELNDTTLTPVFELQPEVVLLGTGDKQVFPPPELMMCFHNRGIGIEVMNTPAACRTFNVLVSELRNVVAVLLQ
ncbi:MAG: Mth938-like domain-containing protein [Xanthomonadales bacterium]|nr:Mth938-like domain-containing protein [Xanthomonadales bacterium]